MISVSNFLPRNLVDQDLYAKTIVILDHILDNYEDEFRDILNKYRDYEEQNVNGVEATITEMGFGNILDVLDMPDDLIATFGYFIGLIGLMKGTSDGIVLVSKILGGDAEVVDWWMSGGTAIPYTYDLTWTVPFGWADPDTFARFLIFLRSYVYPTLDSWIIATTCAFGFDGTDPDVYGFSDYYLDKYWSNGVAVGLGEYYTPTTPNALLYECTVAGTTGATEPTWLTTIGDTQTDNTVTWEVVAPTNMPGGCLSFVFV